jgi:very-short-patch-repair endonuclease
MTAPALPPLDGSVLFDPWRRRYREQLGLAPDAEPVRRPTRSEVMLWERLSDRAPAWVAEHSTAYGYSLDFYCAEVRLAIEVDGASHWGQRKAQSDGWRDTLHDRTGLRTKRFSAREVEQELDWVVGQIDTLVVQRRIELAAAPEVPDQSAVEELAEDERLRLFPPDPPGWSASLPACLTVLPEFEQRRSRFALLSR